MGDLFNLAGRVAVVTGGAQGLGAAMGRALAEHGASVALLDAQKDALSTTASQLVRDTGQEIVGLACDTRDASQVESSVASPNKAICNPGGSQSSRQETWIPRGCRFTR